jgi:7-carboxy-7-deazaguanine synthase
MPSSNIRKTLKINEIFYSIQGESTLVGIPTVFVRLTACNLRCTYCDTTYSYYEGQVFPVEEVLEKIQSFGARAVCITGGEPLLQKQVLPLMTTLCDLGYTVSLETSGSLSCKDVDLRVKLVIDVKTPDSGAANSFDFANLSLAHEDIEFKFVICSETDLEWSEVFCRQHQIFEKFIVLYSPSYRNLDARWLAEKILQKKSSARLQLQLHKYIWSPEARGV